MKLKIKLNKIINNIVNKIKVLFNQTYKDKLNSNK